ncbi:MAG: hypothetical protein Q3986_06545 [Akkermansia sp.]|nr:hypothetical protein [Akkermansia sp.]
MADAVYTFGADTTELVKGIQQVADNTNTMANSMTAVLSRVGGAFEGVKAIAETVWQGVRAAIEATLEPAQRVEQVAVKLGQQMGSVTGGKELASMLELDSANGTKSLEELAKAAGVLSAQMRDPESLRQWVAVLHDISEGSGVSMDTLAGSIQKALATGQAASRSVMPLISAGIPIIQELSKETGIACDEIMAAMKRGEISAGSYMAALQRLTAEGGKYEGMAAQMSNTGKGSVATMWASLEIVLGKIGEMFNSIITPVVQNIASWLQSIAPQVESWVQSYYEAVKPNIDATMDFLGALWEVVKAVGSVLASLLKSLPVLGAWKLQTTIQKVVIQELTVLLKGLAIIIDLVAKGLNYLLGGVLVDEMVAQNDKLRESRERLAKQEEQAASAADSSAAGALASAAALGEEADAASKASKQWHELARARWAAEKQRADKVADMSGERFVKAREAKWNTMNPADAITSILSTVYKSSKADVLKRMQEIEEHGSSMSEDEYYLYQRLSYVLEQIGKQEARQEKLAEERLKLKKQVNEAEGRYAEKQAAALAATKGLAAEEELLRDKLRALGVEGADVVAAIGRKVVELSREDVKGNKVAIEQLQQLREGWDQLTDKKARFARTQRGDLTELKARALEGMGRNEEARRLREKEKVERRIEELRNQGASKRLATEQAILESEVARLNQIDALMQRSRGTVGTHGSGYGNGYFARSFGGDQLSEAKKSNQLLQRIARLCEKLNQGTGNQAFVLS